MTIIMTGVENTGGRPASLNRFARCSGWTTRVKEPLVPGGICLKACPPYVARASTALASLPKQQFGGAALNCRNKGSSSRPEDSHLRALPDPYVDLSIHTAPDVRPFP